MDRLYDETLQSIERQFQETAHINTNEELYEHGTAQFTQVFKDLRMKKRRFMSRRSELTTGLVLSSVLKAANEQRLRVNKRSSGDENYFGIVKMRKIE